MKLLESYCDRLLKCDTAVTRSSEVTQFFMPKDHELQSDFTKNRYDCHVGVYFEIMQEISLKNSYLSHTAS